MSTNYGVVSKDVAETSSPSKEDRTENFLHLVKSAGGPATGRFCNVAALYLSPHLSTKTARVTSQGTLTIAHLLHRGSRAGLQQVELLLQRAFPFVRSDH